VQIIGHCIHSSCMHKPTLIRRLFADLTSISQNRQRGSTTALFNSLVKDPDLVQFFENIPGLCKSSIVDNPLLRVTWLGKKKLYMAAKELLDRTW
jgi:hypothetical protein